MDGSMPQDEVHLKWVRDRLVKAFGSPGEAVSVLTTTPKYRLERLTVGHVFQLPDGETLEVSVPHQRVRVRVLLNEEEIRRAEWPTKEWRQASAWAEGYRAAVVPGALEGSCENAP